MDPRNRLLELIQLVYAAPGSQEGWQTFLDELCFAMNGSAAHFLSVSHAAEHASVSQHVSVSMTVHTDPAALRAYDDHWGAYDPWGHGLGLRTISSGSVVAGDALITHAQLKKTAYYNDFGRSYDMVRAVIGTIETGPHTVSVISINGTERRGPFETEESELLTALMPHLHRGLQLHRRLVTAEACTDDFAAAINCATRAILLVNAAGRVTFMNQAAERLTAAKDGLTVGAGELRAARVEDTNHIRALLADTFATSDGHGVGVGGALALGRPSGRRPLMVLVAPLSRRRTCPPGAELAASMVIVTDPEQTAVPDEQTIRAFLGLTPAEVKLARLVVEGFTLYEAATRLCLRIETVRTRMKTIFEKTNTHRQADLVRLVLNGTRGL